MALLPEPLSFIARWQEEPYASARAALLAGDASAPALVGAGGVLDLRGVDLRGGRLRDLTGWSLRGARFDFARLDDVDARGADLAGAYFVFASMCRARLDHASLARATANGAVLSWSSCPRADLRDADLTGALLDNADLRAADLTNARLRFADLMNAEIWGATLPLRKNRFTTLWRPPATTTPARAVPPLGDVEGARVAQRAVRTTRTFAPPATPAGAEFDPVRACEGLAWAAASLDNDVIDALRREAWAPQILAALMAAVAPARLQARADVVEALWAAVQKRTRASPHVAAVAYVLDAAFADRAAAARAACDDATRAALDALAARQGAAIDWLARLQARLDDDVTAAWARRV